MTDQRAIPPVKKLPPTMILDDGDTKVWLVTDDEPDEAADKRFAEMLQAYTERMERQNSSLTSRILSAKWAWLVFGLGLIAVVWRLLL